MQGSVSSPRMSLLKRTTKCSSRKGGVWFWLALVAILSPLTALAQPAPGEPAPSDAAPANDEPENVEGEDGEINARNAEIANILRVFSRRLKRNYILDERVRGKVTMYLPGKLSAEQALTILDTVLALKGFAAVPIHDNTWKVVPAREARQTTIPTVVGSSHGDPTASVVTRLLNLKYVPVEDVHKIINDLISPDGLVTAHAGTNSLILIDYENNIERILEIISALDVPFTDRDMTIIPVKNAEAAQIAEKLKELLGEGSQGQNEQESGIDLIRNRQQANFGAPPGMPSGMPGRPPVSPQGGAPAGTTTTARSRAPKITSDERTNSIIIVADEESTARIRALVAQLDSQVDLSGHRFYVYRCQHADAEELAQVLGNLAGGGGGSGTTGGAPSTRRASLAGDGEDNPFGGRTGGSGRQNRNQRTQSRLGNTSRTPGQSRREGQGGGAPSSVQFGDDLSITADPATNSLIINADKTSYEKLKSLIDKLDVKRRQVLVEAMILEVSVDDQQVLGTDFLASGGGADGGIMGISNLGGSQGLQGLLSNPTQLSNFSLAAASAGTISLPGNIVLPSQAALLSAAQTNSNVNVLSAPTLLATDNEEAEIVVGQNVPFLASQSTSDTNLNNTFNQIDRQDVGITLRITPQISSNDFVTLKIFTDVSDIVPAADTTLGPTTTVRSSETTVITKDAQMIAIGGLMADQTNDSESGVPFLKDIPILGHAFKRFTGRRTRSNLLTFLTPRIVKDQFDARDATIARRNRMRRAIEEDRVSPSREEILGSSSIDRVTEITSEEFEKHGTILPPAGNQAPVIAKKRAVSAPAPGRLGDAPIEIDVSPELPASSQGSIEQRHGGRYVVMKIVKRGDKGTKLPFKETSKGFIGVHIPEGSAPAAMSFFQIGGRYTYNLEGREVEVEPVEVHPTPTAATSAHGLTKAMWYELSPYEMMNLGGGPWTRKGEIKRRLP